MVIASNNNVISHPIMVLDKARTQRGVTCAYFTLAEMKKKLATKEKNKGKKREK